MTLTVECDGKHIITVEGLADQRTGELSALQQMFIDEYAFQCGFCTPGVLMVTKALLDKNPHPTRAEIEDALSGNYCRCISQYHVLEAIEKFTRREDV
jgi:carbon-monoxide dehydrogenase small subunit